jgi:DNA-directed RNA polymerase specialized sigma24 family protein
MNGRPNSGLFDGPSLKEHMIALQVCGRKAAAGDGPALQEVIRGLQDGLFGLSLRVLGNREEAENATQEMLVQIAAGISHFSFRQKLRTWAYHIAVKVLLEAKESRVERRYLSFERFAEDLTANAKKGMAWDDEKSVLLEETKISCTFEILQCLTRTQRVVFLLCDVWDFSGSEAVEIIGVPSEILRKRLQLARSAIRKFGRHHCGLVSDIALCRCHRQIFSSLDSGKVQLEALQFATRPASFVDIRTLVRSVEQRNRRSRFIARTSRGQHPLISHGVWANGWALPTAAKRPQCRIKSTISPAPPCSHPGPAGGPSAKDAGRRQPW